MLWKTLIVTVGCAHQNSACAFALAGPWQTKQPREPLCPHGNAGVPEIRDDLRIK